MYSDYMDDKKDEKSKIEIGKSNNDNNKKERHISGDIFVYIILFAVIIGFIALIVTKVIKNKKYTNEEIEQKLVEKAKEYVATNKINKETYLDNQKLSITLNKNCSELSGVLYLNGNYYPNLMCKEYKSDLSFFDNKDENFKLKGDAFIVIAEGVTFADPLYETEYTTIRKFGSALPTEGIYNIEYFAIDNNISVGSLRRKVIVVKNEDEFNKSPKITLSGESSVTTDKGREYRDSGTNTQDANGRSLKPIVYDNIDILKDGNYLVIYEAIDEVGRRSYATRNVMVVNNGYDLTIDVSKDPSEKTNTDVTIKLNIQGSSYKRTILPDDTESTSKLVTYKVSENGKYTFKVVDAQGNEFPKEVTVDNISKETPKGTCKATLKDKKLTIDVDVTSSNEVDSYKYKIDYRSSEFIKDNPYVYDTEKAENVSVIIKDVYKNQEEISCEVSS